MAKTTTYTTDNVGNPEPVQVPMACRRVTIREQGAAGTTDYFVRAPSSTDSQFRKVAGEATVFEAQGNNLFQANDIVGYTETVTVSITMSMICE